MSESPVQNILGYKGNDINSINAGFWGYQEVVLDVKAYIIKRIVQTYTKDNIRRIHRINTRRVIRGIKNNFVIASMMVMNLIQ